MLIFRFPVPYNGNYNTSNIIYLYIHCRHILNPYCSKNKVLHARTPRQLAEPDFLFNTEIQLHAFLFFFFDHKIITIKMIMTYYDSKNNMFCTRMSTFFVVKYAIFYAH